MKKIKNVKVNMLIYSIKSILSIIFPLITFPYVSRVLHVENIGKYNFANSVISYFVLLAGLGVAIYATREGAKIRNDREAINTLASEVFSINVISTIISYALLFVCVFSVRKLWENRVLLLVLSITIAFTTIGREWIYSIYEDYLFLTVRYIVFQFVSIILLFTLVKKPSDYLLYAAVSVISSSGANIWNYFNGKKYCTIHLVFSKRIFRHLKPILIFFSTTVAVTIYVNSDMTILGFMTGDRSVGLYSISVKIYNILKTVMVSMVAVTIPRFSALVGQGEKGRQELKNTATDTYSLLISVLLPTLVGVWIEADDVINIVGGSEYLAAAPSLRILSGALVCCIVGYFWGDGILVANNQEHVLLKGTLLSAAINIGLNLLFIPIGEQNAAAFTTFISEATSAIIFSTRGKRYIKIDGIGNVTVKVVIGCLGISVIALVTNLWKDNLLFHIVTTVIGGIVVYATIELVLKNDAVLSIVDGVKRKMSSRFKRQR